MSHGDTDRAMPRAPDHDATPPVRDDSFGDSSRPQLLVLDLGTVGYAEALELQRSVARRRIAGEIDHDVLLLVQHPHVITLGRSYKGKTLVASEEHLRRRGVEVVEVDRGGDVTYHGPGQLVGYPIFDLKGHKRDLHWYLRQVEEALIHALASLQIAASRSPGLTGVWVSADAGPQAQRGEGSGMLSDAPAMPARKIASIGVHARDWVTWHGFALNVTSDLSYFDLMVPCGIDNVQMTSVARERPDAGIDLSIVSQRVADAFASVFFHQSEPVTLRRDLKLLEPARLASHG